MITKVSESFKVSLEYEFDSREEAEEFIHRVEELKGEVDLSKAARKAVEAIKAISGKVYEYHFPLLPVSLLFDLTLDPLSVIEDHYTSDIVTIPQDHLVYYLSVRLREVKVHGELLADERKLLGDMMGIAESYQPFSPESFLSALKFLSAEWPYHFLLPRHDEFRDDLAVYRESLGVMLKFTNEHPGGEEVIYRLWDDEA